ncbi:MAG TPA: hypothetical protein G4O12_01540 [Dehalococcoidia bacterium]|nr:hypothetical protein [Dehalococcoidia bacterium]
MISRLYRQGNISLYLKVQDNNGTWSDEVRSRVAVSGEAVAAPVIISFNASPGSITSGGSSTLSWNVSDATTVSIDRGIGNVALTGNRAVSLSTTATYTLTATNEAGSVTATAQVIVSAAPPPPPAGLPVISSFTANPGSITAGDASTLSWSVSDAAVVTIDHGVGAVAAVGSTSVSPATTTSYTLTATNAAGWASATTQIIVSAAPPTEHTVTILPVVDESGYVRDTGVPWPKFIYVGDDNNDISLQAFASFDISGIPAGATILSVVVDFSDYNTIYGDPFGSLGCLRVYPHDYGSLDGGDYFAGSPLGALLRYCSAGEIVAHSDTYVKDALQAKVGSSRFQVRFQFNETATDGAGDNDLVAWTSSHLPKLIVTYSGP